MPKVTLDTPILVVDDSISARLMMKHKLEQAGYASVVDAASVASAWSLLERPALGIGLVLSDHNMPNETGLSFLTRVRADPRFKELPFIMISAEGAGGVMTSAIEAGVSRYIPKPVKIDVLLQEIEQLR
jgi:two-component system chemotaxis response regulator CheY